jgi:PleD family two-component response regulator
MRAKPYFAMVLDVDDFKSVNDTHGHAAGDKGDSAASLFERADEALYSAKKTGKKCLVAKRRSGLPDFAKK